MYYIWYIVIHIFQHYLKYKKKQNTHKENNFDCCLKKVIHLMYTYILLINIEVTQRNF